MKIKTINKPSGVQRKSIERLKGIIAGGSVITIAALAIVGLGASCKNQKTDTTNASISTISLTNAYDVNLFDDPADEAKLNARAEKIYNQFDKNDINFTFNDVKETLRFLYGIKTEKEYTDIELFDLSDEVLRNGMDTYFVDIVNYFAGITSKDKTKKVNYSIYALDGSIEQAIIKKFDNYVNSLIDTTDKETKLKIIDNILKDEFSLIYNQLEINDKKVSLDEIDPVVLIAYMESIHPVVVTIGGENIKTEVITTNAEGKEEKNICTAKNIINRLNKKDCIISTKDGDFEMDKLDAAMINLANKQKSLYNKEENTILKKTK